jgi:type II secretory pathway predicted ATPase ExeA
MMGSVAAMPASLPTPGSHPVSTIYQAIGLLDDPFPRDPEAGVFVELDPQMAVFGEVRDWLSAPLSGALGLAVVAGANGTGKTRLLGRLVESLGDDDRLIGVVPGNGSRRSDAQLVRELIVALGGTPAGRTGLELTTELRAILDEHRVDLLPPILLVDNAALSGSQLEIMRSILLVTTSVPQQTRVQIVLFGPPELPDRIARRRSLAQLTRKTLHLGQLPESAIGAFLTTRAAAVRDREADPLFTANALRSIARSSQGNPALALAIAHTVVREAIATGRMAVDAVVANNASVAVLALQGPTTRIRAADGDEGAIQTRLSLPGMEDVAEAPPLTRRRRQQR